MKRVHRNFKTALLATVCSLSMASASLADDFNEALTSAYNTNPRIKSERETYEALSEQISQAVSGFLPNVGAGYSYGKNIQEVPHSNDARKKNINTKQLSVTQPIFNGGETWARYKSAKNIVKAGRARLRSVEQETMLQAISAYMDVVQGQSVVELSQNNVSVLKKQGQATQDRFDVGEVTRTDVAQSGARVSRAESDYSQAKGDLESARAQFKRLIGFSPDKILTMPEGAPPLPASLEEATKIALENNPNSLSTDYQARSAEYDVWTRKSALLPSVNVQGTAVRDDSKGGLFGIAERNDTLVMNVNIPLYQSGAEYSRIREAKNNLERRKFEAVDSRNETVENVTRAWERLQTNRATIESNRAAIQAAEVALDGVKQEQQYGARTTLDVLDAEQELFVARVNLVRSIRNEQVTMYNLLAVMGDLSPEVLGLKVETYDSDEAYNNAKWHIIGF